MQGLNLWSLIALIALCFVVFLVFGQVKTEPGQRFWTAPADDSVGTGKLSAVASYVIKYSQQPITELNWDSSITYPNNITPKAPGSPESILMENLPRGVWYFAVKSIDSAGNVSGVSNIVKKFVDKISPKQINDLQ